MNHNIENKIDLLSQTLANLTVMVKELGEPAFRTKQIYSWLHEKQITSISEMTNLSKSLRDKLEASCYIPSCEVVARQTSAADDTNKFLLELDDGNCIETVWMEYKHGVSLCVSTQVGCRQGCKFCASTLGGLVRNLTAGEILNQVYTAQRVMGMRVASIVLMGIGEPLDNLDNVLDFFTILSSQEGQRMSLRHVSLSTCGIVPAIEALMEKDLGVTLSISLHASDNNTRSGIMPINDKYDIHELMTVCKKYFAHTGRRISYEYALIEGVNDTEEDAESLARLLKGQMCHVNLIPVNPVKERDTKRSSRKNVQEFVGRLIKRGVNATIRRELGTDIDAACGQLRRNHSNTETNEQAADQ